MLRLVVSIALAMAVGVPAVPDVTTAYSCAADLGIGIKSKRKFCDILISAQGRDGVAMLIPPHAGTTTLRFDLHNRHLVPAPGTPAQQIYAKHTAVVAVLDQAGAVVGRAAVSREIRTDVDIFDRVAGGVGPNGAIMVAPGRAEPVTITLPASVTSIAVVGVSLDSSSLSEQRTFTTPGRPVAVGSNFRIEYSRK